MMKTNVQIDFQLLGTAVPPRDISKITGIVPDVELMRGERNKQLDLPRQSIWSIRSCSESNELADHWSSLAEILGGARLAIKEVAKTGIAKMTLIINSDQRIPSIVIPPEMSEFAGFVKAVIDIDHMQN